MKTALMLSLTTLASGCAGRDPEPEHLNAPNPEGCYIRVWDGAMFSGGTDYINGPSRYSDLRGMPGGRRWHNRIRSVQVGSTATATLYADTDFRGSSFPLQRESRYPQLPENISGEIESLIIDCADPPADELKP